MTTNNAPKGGRTHTVYTFPQYEQHPLALALMPGGMDDMEFQALCDDIAERGLIVPVTLFEGKVLDGWHRYRACKKTGTKLTEWKYEGKDPAGYIAAMNLLRRRLSSLQRALVGARLHRDHGLTQRAVCQKLGISNEAVNLVLKALDSKSSRLIKKIEQDSDFTRGMLKSELEDAGLWTHRTREEGPPEGQQERRQNSVFDTGHEPMDGEDLLGGSDTNGISAEGEGEDEDPIGRETALPDTGRKNGHAERRAKQTAAMRLAQDFKALMMDEKVSFLQIVWPEAAPIIKELKLSTERPSVVTEKPLTPEAALAATEGQKAKARKPAAWNAAAKVIEKAAKGSKQVKA